MIELHLYRCPACLGTLADERDAWACAGCAARYEVPRGVPLLMRAESASPGFVGVMKRKYDQPDRFLNLAEASGAPAASWTRDRQAR
ncbi:MAG TPA: hypothetical protein VFZ81_06070 [Burkholderiales bacterium]